MQIRVCIDEFLFYIDSSNFLKLNVYYADLQNTTVRQESSYGIMVLIGNNHARIKRNTG